MSPDLRGSGGSCWMQCRDWAGEGTCGPQPTEGGCVVRRSTRREVRATGPRTPPVRGRRRIPPELVPRHVAIVMDGNGRWAKQRGLPRTAGHEQGEHALFDVVEGAIEIGVKAISAYAFSTENWSPLARRGALPDGLQPRRDPAPARRDARARRPGPVGRPRAAAVALGDQGAPGRRGADPRQRRADADDVRQLRRPRRARRRGAVHRPRRRGRTARTPTGSTRRRSRGTSTCPSSPTPTWSGAPRGSSGCPTSCSGRRRTPSSSSPTCSGPTSTAAPVARRSTSTPRRDRRYGGA